MFIMADILPFCKVVKNSMCLSYCASQKKSIPFFVFLNKLFVRFIIFQTNHLFLYLLCSFKNLGIYPVSFCCRMESFLVC